MLPVDGVSAGAVRLTESPGHFTPPVRTVLMSFRKFVARESHGHGEGPQSAKQSGDSPASHRALPQTGVSVAQSAGHEPQSSPALPTH